MKVVGHPSADEPGTQRIRTQASEIRIKFETEVSWINQIISADFVRLGDSSPCENPETGTCRADTGLSL